MKSGTHLINRLFDLIAQSFHHYRLPEIYMIVFFSDGQQTTRNEHGSIQAIVLFMILSINAGSFHLFKAAVLDGIEHNKMIKATSVTIG